MAGVTSTSGDNIRIPRILTPLQRLINDYSWFEKGMLDATQKFNYQGESRFNIPLKYSMPEGAFVDLNTTVAPTNITTSQYQTAYDYLRVYGIALSFTQGALMLLGGNYANAGKIDYNKEDFIDAATACALDLESAFFYGGSTGALGTVVSADNVTKKICLNNNAMLREQMVVDIFLANGSAKTGTAIVIDGIDDDDKISITSAAGSNLSAVSAGHVLYKTGIHTTVTAKLPNGLSDLIKNTGSIHNLALSTNSWYSAFVHNGASPGTPEKMTLKLLQRIMAKPTRRGRPVAPVSVWEQDVYEAIAERFREENQPTVPMASEDGMPAGLTYMYGKDKQRIYAVIKMPLNTGFMYDPSKLIKYQHLTDDFLNWGTLDGKGGMKLVRTTGMEQQAFFCTFRQIGILDPKACVRVNDIKGLSAE